MKRMLWQVVRKYIRKVVTGQLGKRQNIYLNWNWRRTLELQFNAYKVYAQDLLHKAVHLNLCGYAFSKITRKKCIMWSLQHSTVENIRCMRCQIVLNFRKIFPLYPRQYNARLLFTSNTIYFTVKVIAFRVEKNFVFLLPAKSFVAA